MIPEKAGLPCSAFFMVVVMMIASSIRGHDMHAGHAPIEARRRSQAISPSIKGSFENQTLGFSIA
jgi:hypothetical protein